MRALVTGGAGFIGSHVVDALLARGDDVVVVDDLSHGRRDNVDAAAELVERDIREPLDDVFAEARPDVCFHLAAQASVTRSVADPGYDTEVNVVGTVRVLEAARATETQVVFSSTGGAIYGECERPAREGDPELPISPYGMAKLAAEHYVAGYNRLHGTSHASLRYANVYGPRQDPHGEAGVVAIFFGLMAGGGKPQIYGDGLQTRDYTYVGDVVSATLAAAGAGGVYNVGTGVETSVVELFELCRTIAGVEIEPEFAPARLGELQRSVLDPSLAGEALHWRPETPLAEGLRRTWQEVAERART